MTRLLEELSESIESIIRLNALNKYNISLGYFQNYSSVDVDSSGTRFCDIKLHYKDEKGEDIGALDVPLIYHGNGNTVDDFALEKGCELAVFFSDRSLEQWVSGAEPQALSNKVRDSKNHAFAIPISTHHTFKDVTALAIDATVGRRILVKSGKKIQIGTDTDEMMKIHYDLITAYSAGVDTSTGIFNNQVQITALQAQLANITKTV
jgi:hypothetical protein